MHIKTAIRQRHDIGNFRIARNKVNLVTAAGRRSADAYYARTARLIAERLPCRYVEVPGNHLAFLNDTAAFAAALREVLHQLAA